MFGNIFGQKPQAPTQAPAAATPAQAPATPAPTPAPLDQFKDIWNAPAPTPAVASALDLDVQKVAASAGNLDFTKVIPADTAARIAQGGQGAAEAFMKAMAQVAQGVTAHSQLQTAELVKTALAEQQQTLMSMMKSQMTQTAVADGMRAENPLMSHTAVQPIVYAVQAQLQKQYPGASTSELRSMTQDYIKQFATAVNPAPAPKSATKQMDWSAWMAS
jgi:hypothetical protein